MSDDENPYQLTAEEKERALRRAHALRERLVEKARQPVDDGADVLSVIRPTYARDPRFPPGPYTYGEQ